MTVLLDANVLVALASGDHVHHDAASRWDIARTEPFATCPITQGALIRLAMREGIRVDEALASLRSFVDEADHEFWPDDVTYLDIRTAGLRGHRQVTDAYLAGLARHHRGRLATLDQGLAAIHPDVVEVIRIS